MRWIIALVALVILVGGGAYYLYARRARPAPFAQPPGFMDVVQNPQQAGAQWDEHDRRVAELARRPHQEIVEALLVDASMEGVAAEAIKLVGPDIVPALLKAVDDPRFRGGSQFRYGDRSMPLEPLEGVIDGLTNFSPPEAVAVVAPLAADKSEDIRKNVALLLGSIGTTEAAIPLVQLLGDEETYVRGYCLMGIERAVAARRAQPEFKKALFDPVMPLAFKSEMGVSDAPDCLLALDRERAIEVLTTDEALAPAQENLLDILEALRTHRVPVEEARLLALAAELDKAATEYFVARALSEVLRLLALHDSPQARAAIESGAKHAQMEVREGAAWARLDAMGIDDPLGFAFSRRGDGGWDVLTPPQRKILAVQMLENEVNNGGFYQYFFNSSGDSWPDALAGLKEMGADVVGGLLAKAVARFGSEEPSTDRETRQAQLARLAERQTDFTALEDEFYKDENSVQVPLLKYIAAHADDFRPPRERTDP